ncbi:hypothetical protein [Comamonas thiooxydans]|uniref:hypothetical protein n=1 Tax=Comamonas thiooxydans TaxID=363952 RepID=UPI000B407A04|nr:hypothetical protein [Comamonas thiooxydans]
MSIFRKLRIFFFGRPPVALEMRKITAEDVRRANQRLMENRKEDEGEDVYTRNGLRRPTPEEIENAGRLAMQKMREEGRL